MSTAREIVALKGKEVVTIDADATVLDAARVMNERGVGGLVVTETDGTALVGIFTERDILKRVVATALLPGSVKVREVCTKAMITCLPETSMDECGAIMTNKRIRHLPVLDANGLQGLVSIGDVLAHRVKEQAATIQYLNSYMFDVR